MDTKRVAVYSTLIIGIVSLLNPLYFAPGNLDGTASEVTYEVTAIETTEEARQALYESEATLLCGVGGERPCVLEREIADRGQIEFDGTLADRQAYDGDPYQRQNSRYALVQLDDGFFVPETNRTGNTTVLTHRTVSTMAALEHVAIPSNQTSPEVRDALESGSVRTRDARIPEFEQKYPIKRGDDVYRVDSITYDTTPDYEILAVRLTLFVLGVSLVSYSVVSNSETDSA